MRIARTVSLDPELLYFSRNVERSLLLYIAVTMRDKQLSLHKARLQMQDYLSLMPFFDKEDLLHKLSFLSSKYRECAFVFLKYGVPFYESKRVHQLEQVRMDLFLRGGDISVW